MKENDVILTSYRRHEDGFADHVDGGPDENRGRSWLLPDTVDAYRHERMFNVIVHACSLGKIGIHLGGAAQILFGIRVCGGTTIR